MLQPNAGNSETSATTSLRPMGFTDILDTMFNLYRRNFRLFASICAVYFVYPLFGLNYRIFGICTATIARFRWIGHDDSNSSDRDINYACSDAFHAVGGLILRRCSDLFGQDTSRSEHRI